MNLEEKYRQILFILAEHATIMNYPKVQSIMTALMNWRYTLVNSVEGQQYEEWLECVNNAFNQILKECNIKE